MPCKPVLDFFLGALAPCGFRGWFAEAAAEPGHTAYLIKAGPGCGKSTLMRRLADADAAHAAPRGVHRIERLHCSSDPNSLDGVLLTDVGALVLDATAPHTLDCKYPGAAEQVLSLYDALDNTALAAQRQAILALGRRNTGLLAQAGATFALACGLLQQRRQIAGQAVDTAKLDRFAARLAARTMPRRPGVQPGLQRHRLLSAPTPGGPTVFYDTIPQLAHTALYAIHDPYGAASTRMLAALAGHARRNGYEAFLCHCPTDQEQLDHLFLPELGLGFVTANGFHPMLFANQHNLHASRFWDSQALAGQRGRLREQKRLAATLLEATCDLQAQAKAVHDGLEQYYIHATDFDAVDATRKKLEQALFR